jgi:hypothetical protein
MSKAALLVEVVKCAFGTLLAGMINLSSFKAMK